MHFALQSYIVKLSRVIPVIEVALMFWVDGETDSYILFVLVFFIFQIESLYGLVAYTTHL